MEDCSFVAAEHSHCGVQHNNVQPLNDGDFYSLTHLYTRFAFVFVASPLLAHRRRGQDVGWGEERPLVEGFRYGFPEILMGWLRFGAASLMCQEFELSR